jgi:hypothetical protein
VIKSIKSNLVPLFSIDVLAVATHFELGSKAGLKAGLKLGSSWAQPWTQGWAHAWAQGWAQDWAHCFFAKLIPFCEEYHFEIGPARHF